ncbi:MAG: hypothetical protein EXS21_13090, partial [Pedosphaera sp.]|nr:hypothetical protein [Pedosphaera sp.]
MKLTSWNVNGLRAALGKGLLNWIAQEGTDVICLQEVKAMPEQVSVEWPSGYSVHWNSAERKGYSGTLTLSRRPVLSVERGLGSWLPDNEGRVLTVEPQDQFVVKCYKPNTKRDLSRLPYRELEWDLAFRAYLKALEARKPVVFCRDLNVAHEEADSDPRLQCVFLGNSRAQWAKTPLKPPSDHESDTGNPRCATFQHLPNLGVYSGVRGSRDPLA